METVFDRQWILLATTRLTCSRVSAIFSVPSISTTSNLQVVQSGMAIAVQFPSHFRTGCLPGQVERRVALSTPQVGEKPGANRTTPVADASIARVLLIPAKGISGATRPQSLLRKEELMSQLGNVG